MGIIIIEPGGKKCAYHRDREAVGQCRSCGKYLCEEHGSPDNGPGLICPACMAREALSDMDTEREERRAGVNRKKEETAKRRSRRSMLLWGGLVLGLSLMAIQFPKIIKTFYPEYRPVRLGAGNTDQGTDRCLENLWLISRDMQQGKTPGENLVCPVCGRPYRVEETNGNMTVSCPCPRAHGVSGLGVSSDRPVPEVVP